MHLEKTQDVDMLLPTAIKATLRILDYHNIVACMVGELAYNYYNVPDVVHVCRKPSPFLTPIAPLVCAQHSSFSLSHALQDVEMCVRDQDVENASLALTETGLYKIEPYKDIHAHNEYKIRFSRLTTTGWLPHQVSFVIFPASFCGLHPLETHVFRPGDYAQPGSQLSKEILDSISEDDVKSWYFPRLTPFVTGLVKRYLETGDDMAAAAVEHLVDGLNLSDAWCGSRLYSASPGITEFFQRLVNGKKSRIAYYQDNTVTCMIADKEQANRVTRIPGYEL